jgi:hypothetical protein
MHTLFHSKSNKKAACAIYNVWMYALVFLTHLSKKTMKKVAQYEVNRLLKAVLFRLVNFFFSIDPVKVKVKVRLS